MNAKYWQRGETIDYKNGGATTITAGSIVSLATRVGIAGMDIAAGATGTLHMGGVFEVEKDANAIAAGAAVYYDESEDCFTATAAGNIPAGYAVAAAAAGDDVVLVNIIDPTVDVAALLHGGTLASIALKQGADIYDLTVSAAGALVITKRV